MEGEGFKQFYLNPSSEEAALEFIDLLDDIDLEKVDVVVDYGLGRLKIKIYGPSPFIKKAYKKILKNYKVVENKYKKRNGMYKYVISDLEEHLGTSIPTDLLIKILKDLKFKIEIVSDDVFKTNANYDRVMEIIFDINYYFRISKKPCASKTLRNVVTRIAIVTGKDPYEILENCLEKKLLRIKNEKYELATSPSKILKQYNISDYTDE